MLENNEGKTKGSGSNKVGQNFNETEMTKKKDFNETVRKVSNHKGLLLKAHDGI